MMFGKQYLDVFLENISVQEHLFLADSAGVLLVDGWVDAPHRLVLLDATKVFMLLVDVDSEQSTAVCRQPSLGRASLANVFALRRPLQETRKIFLRGFSLDFIRFSGLE